MCILLIYTWMTALISLTHKERERESILVVSEVRLHSDISRLLCQIEDTKWWSHNCESSVDYACMITAFTKMPVSNFKHRNNFVCIIEVPHCMKHTLCFIHNVFLFALWPISFTYFRLLSLIRIWIELYTPA